MQNDQFGFAGLRAEYRQDGKSTLEACLHKCIGRIDCIVRQQNMSMKHSGMRMGSVVARKG